MTCGLPRTLPASMCSSDDKFLSSTKISTLNMLPSCLLVNCRINLPHADTESLAQFAHRRARLAVGLPVQLAYLGLDLGMQWSRAPTHDHFRSGLCHGCAPLP